MFRSRPREARIVRRMLICSTSDAEPAAPFWGTSKKMRLCCLAPWVLSAASMYARLAVWTIGIGA